MALKSGGQTTPPSAVWNGAPGTSRASFAFNFWRALADILCLKGTQWPELSVTGVVPGMAYSGTHSASGRIPPEIEEMN
jgi:hypothetical protein